MTPNIAILVGTAHLAVCGLCAIGAGFALVTGIYTPWAAWCAGLLVGYSLGMAATAAVFSAAPQ